MSNQEIICGDLAEDGIQQGYLGDCYYISALSAYAEHPRRMKALILTDTLNQGGVFATQMYIKGQPFNVVVDDYIPFYDGKPAFAGQGRENSIWGMMMEKSWAKVHGNYDRTDGGLEIEMFDSAGAPNIYYDFDDQSGVARDEHKLYNVLKDAFDKDYSMACAVLQKEGRDNKGLVDGHAYSGHVIKIVNYHGSNTCFIKVRNPHGVDSWSGAFSDIDSAMDSNL